MEEGACGWCILAKGLALAVWRGGGHWCFGEEIDIGILFTTGILASRLTMTFMSKAGGWGLAALKLDAVKRNNMNYDLT
jgi:hypothetical protein